MTETKISMTETKIKLKNSLSYQKTKFAGHELLSGLAKILQPKTETYCRLNCHPRFNKIKHCHHKFSVTPPTSSIVRQNHVPVKMGMLCIALINRNIH